MKDFHRLQVWRKAHSFTLLVYRATGAFPKHELFGLTSQLRHASASIAANIAEGCGRTGNAEMLRFLNMAQGSASEVQYHLLLCRDLGYLGAQQYNALGDAAGEVKRMLVGLITKIREDKKSAGFNLVADC